MNIERLKQILLDQKEAFNSKKKLIERDINLQPYIDTSQIVVITGVRRCGKSTLLYLIKRKMNLLDSEYCYFNFDDERIINTTGILEKIDNLHKLLYGNEAILFFDEIQNVPGWEKFINRLHEQGRKIFITGSNASLLSSEIATSLTGRNKPLELYPFSFKEFLAMKDIVPQFNNLSTNMELKLIAAFNKYLKIGGFPMVIRENDLELLSAYFRDVLYRDIVSRYLVTQVEEIKQIALYFFSNTSKIFSYNTLRKITGIKSLSTIKKYLDYFAQSYLFFYVRKYDFSVKKQILNSRKVYCIDQGFVNHIGFGFSEDRGRVLENVVFIELKRQGNEVFYFSDKKECDFVIRQGFNITQAIQVVYNLHKENINRELAGLQEAIEKFNLKKGLLLVVENQIDMHEIPDNIEVLPVWKWLLSKREK